MKTVGLWLAAISTIAIYSYLWNDNKLYKLAEHVFVALGASHTMVMGYNNIIDVAWKPLTVRGQWSIILPVALGILLYARFWRRIASWSRLPISFIVGVGAALAIRGELSANLVRQIESTVIPLNSVDNVLLVVGVVTTITFFFFVSRVRNRFTEATACLGRWTIMIALGASFGSTVMARLSLVLVRLEFLFGEWLPIIRL